MISLRRLMRSQFTMEILIALMLVVQHLFTGISDGKVAVIKVDKTQVWDVVDEKFLSLGLSSKWVKNKWENFNLTHPRLINMAKALSPAFLRLGGTAADMLTFVKDSNDIMEDKDVLSRHKPLENLTMSSSDWVNINSFVNSVGWQLLFDLNVMKRTSGGHWNSKNAHEIFDFSSSVGFENISWQLGNEPNSFKHNFGTPLDAAQLGRDFKHLKHQLSQYPLYQNSLILGPDINKISLHHIPNTYLQERKRLKEVKGCLLWHLPHLANSSEPYQMVANPSKRCEAFEYLEKFYFSSEGVIDAITWHHYYLDGHSATIRDFLKVSVMETLREAINALDQFMTSKVIQRPMWLGETGSAYGGGAPGISDRYVAAFLWLDKLGLVAEVKKKYKVVVRQSLYHGHYALIGDDLQPNPDFWVSALYKQLVSNKVLRLRFKARTRERNTLRMYAHCTKSLKDDDFGGITIFGFNMANLTEMVKLHKYKGLHEDYILTPKNDDLTGKDILLNGDLLQMGPVDQVPIMTPIKSSVKNIAVPPYSIVFFVFPKFAPHIC